MTTLFKTALISVTLLGLVSVLALTTICGWDISSSWTIHSPPPQFLQLGRAIRLAPTNELWTQGCFYTSTQKHTGATVHASSSLLLLQRSQRSRVAPAGRTTETAWITESPHPAAAAWEAAGVRSKRCCVKPLSFGGLMCYHIITASIYHGLNYVSLKFTCLSPKSPYLWMWLY